MLVLFCVRCRLDVPLACTGATDDRSTRSPRTRSDATSRAIAPSRQRDTAVAEFRHRDTVQ